MTDMQIEIATAFNSLLASGRSLVLPLINELFRTKYSDAEKVSIIGNKVYITDSSTTRSYVLDLAYGPEDSIYLIPYELITEASTTASGETIVSGTVISIAESGILYLRGTVPTKHKLDLNFKIASSGNMMNVLPVMSLYDFGESKIFDKMLYILLPFWLTCDSVNTLFGNRELTGYTIEYADGIRDRLNSEVAANRLSQNDVTRVRNAWDHLLRILWIDYAYPTSGDEPDT